MIDHDNLDNYLNPVLYDLEGSPCGEAKGSWLLAQAVATCEQVRDLFERGVEPFGNVGRIWLNRFMDQIEVNQQG